MGNCCDKDGELQEKGQDEPTEQQIRTNWQENSPIGNMHRTVVSQKRPLMEVVTPKSNKTPSTFRQSSSMTSRNTVVVSQDRLSNNVSSMTRKNTAVVSPIRQPQQVNHQILASSHTAVLQNSGLTYAQKHPLLIPQISTSSNIASAVPKIKPLLTTNPISSIHENPKSSKVLAEISHYNFSEKIIIPRPYVATHQTFNKVLKHENSTRANVFTSNQINHSTNRKKRGERRRKEGGKMENVAVATKKSLLTLFTINDNETGHDYETILAPHFDLSVKNLTVKDPNICACYQIINFFRFCEVAVKHCRNLKSIYLVTCEAENKSKKKKTGKQNSMFDDIALGLKEHGVEFTVKYEVTIDFNSILFDSRLVIHINRGLNIFKSVNKFCIGYYDYTQRKCFNSVIEMANDQGSNDIGFVSQEKSKAAKNRLQKVLSSPQKNMHPVQIKISDGETGYDYESIIVGYLDSCIKVVNVEDPYIISYHQIINFFRFCEVVVKHCPNLKNILLVTCPESSKKQQKGKFGEQVNLLNNVCKGLNACGVILQVVYQPTLHDREIRFDNGWIIKIGRGLDFFKSTKKLHIGTYDYTQRKCHQTTINIFANLNP